MFKFSNDYLWRKKKHQTNKKQLSVKQLAKLLVLLNKNVIGINFSVYAISSIATFETIHRYSSFYVRWKTVPNDSPSCEVPVDGCCITYITDIDFLFITILKLIS